MKKLAMVLLVLVMVMGMVFAAGGDDKAASGKVRIGFLIRNLNEDFLRLYADNLKKVADAAGVEYRLLDGNSDVATQLDQLNTLLTQGYKYFVIIPQDTAATEQMAKAIFAKGGAAAFSNIQPSVAALKVGKTFFLASSPEAVAGQIQAQIVDSYFKKFPAKAPNKTLNVLYLNGQLGHPAQVNRRLGFMNEAKKLGYTVNIIAEDTANWGAAEAQQKMDTWINAFNGKFNVVVAQNDGMALGAVESLIANKYVDDPSNPAKDVDGDGTVIKVPVIGVDGTPSASDSMKTNKLYATVLQDAVGQSTTAFELVYQTATTGSAIGYATKAGLKATSVVIAEAPANDAAVIAQCWLVPFKPIVK